MYSDIDDIKNDLETFADPRTPVEIDSDTALWEQGGEPRTIQFVRARSGSRPNIKYNGQVLSYEQFLAGESMANLANLATFIARTAPFSHSMIDTSAQLHGDDGSVHAQDVATVLIDRRATQDLPYMSTRVLLVQGEAGIGKTSCLKQLAVQQAQRYLQGAASFLYFYVDAQGRALSRLEDAMAKDLQDLRSQFSYAAVAPLTHHQLLVPIVDGFDELLGSGGYEEAFSSLAAFLSGLDGHGCVIASARSAFFDYRNFHKNATRFSAIESFSYEVDTIQIRPWDTTQIDEYIHAEANRLDRDPEHVLARFGELKASLTSADVELLGKPFYAARVADLVISRDTVPPRQALLDRLIAVFLEREHDKLRDRHGQPLLSVEGHRSFLTELAEEMWWQENKRIDVGTVQAAAGMITEELQLSPTVGQQIVEKVSSYAFLTTGTSEQKTLRFEHEVYYGYFLAAGLARKVGQGGDSLRRFLRRAVIDDILVQQTVRRLMEEETSVALAAKNLSAAVRAGLSDLVARENAGRIIADVFRQSGSVGERGTIRNVVFRKVDFGKSVLRRFTFEGCVFDEVDLTAARLMDCSFQDCGLHRLIVSVGNTRLDNLSRDVAEQVTSLIVREGRDLQYSGPLFNPAKIVKVLGRLGADVADDTDGSEYSAVVQERVDILDRFLMMMKRRYHVSREDMGRLHVTKQAEWPEVERQLRSHGLLIDKTVQRRGPKGILMRLKMPPEVIRGGENDSAASVPEPVRAFWRSLIEEDG